MTESPTGSRNRPRIGVVGVTDGWSTVALADAIAARTGYRLLVDMEHVALDETGAVRAGDVDLCSLDGLVIKKIGAAYGPDMLDRLELLRYIAARGVRVFSDPARILNMMNRLACTVGLRAGGIPMPPTVVTEDLAQGVAAVRRFGVAVLKPLYSTKARGMRLVSGTDAEVAEALREFQAEGNAMMYIQQKLDLPDRDLGVVFLGGEYAGCYARVRGDGSWNTTIHAGGRYEPHEPEPEIVDLARRAQALFDLDFTSVDVVQLETGPVVFEVSAFGGFRGMKESQGVDIAAPYADYVVAETVRGLPSRSSSHQP